MLFQTAFRYILTLFFASVLVFSQFSCNRKTKAPAAAENAAPAAAAPAAADARAEAEQLFATRCAACHGTQGYGDGPGSAALNPKPRNFHDKQWQASVKDEQIEQTIVYGGAAVGKSPAMIANPDLQAKPAVVSALREHIRQLGRE